MEKIIDIDVIIKKKSAKLYKFLPKFVINWIKKIIHQDEVNRIINKYKHLQALDFVRASLSELEISYDVEGLDKIEKDKKYIFASNHPLGGFDGLVLMDAIGQEFPQIRFPVNDLLLNLKNFDPLFVPINKHGRQSNIAAKQFDDMYASDNQVLYFPAGLCSRKQKGKIRDLVWQKSFIQKAIQYKRDIVPIYFSGQNSNFFYRLANIRKFFGIKFNIEMIFLVDELFKQKGSHYLLRFGTPITYASLDRTKTFAQWAETVKERVYAMQN